MPHHGMLNSRCLTLAALTSLSSLLQQSSALSLEYASGTTPYNNLGFVDPCKTDTTGTDPDEDFPDSENCPEETSNDRVVLRRGPCNPLAACTLGTATCYSVMAPRPTNLSADYMDGLSYYRSDLPAYYVDFFWRDGKRVKRCCIGSHRSDCRPEVCMDAPCLVGCAVSWDFFRKPDISNAKVSTVCADDQFTVI